MIRIQVHKPPLVSKNIDIRTIYQVLNTLYALRRPITYAKEASFGLRLRRWRRDLTEFWATGGRCHQSAIQKRRDACCDRRCRKGRCSVPQHYQDSGGVPIRRQGRVDVRERCSRDNWRWNRTCRMEAIADCHHWLCVWADDWGWTGCNRRDCPDRHGRRAWIVSCQNQRHRRKSSHCAHNRATA